MLPQSPPPFWEIGSGHRQPTPPETGYLRLPIYSLQETQLSDRLQQRVQSMCTVAVFIDSPVWCILSKHFDYSLYPWVWRIVLLFAWTCRNLSLPLKNTKPTWKGRFHYWLLVTQVTIYRWQLNASLLTHNRLRLYVLQYFYHTGSLGSHQSLSPLPTVQHIGTTVKITYVYFSLLIWPFSKLIIIFGIGFDPLTGCYQCADILRGHVWLKR